LIIMHEMMLKNPTRELKFKKERSHKHMGLVRKAADAAIKKYGLPNGYTFDDLIGEGFVTLLTLEPKYKRELSRESTYYYDSVYWSIVRFILRTKTNYLQRVLFAIKRDELVLSLYSRLKSGEEIDLSKYSKAVLERLESIKSIEDYKQLIKSLNRRKLVFNTYSNPKSLDSPVDEDPEFTYGDLVESSDPLPSDFSVRKQLQQKINTILFSRLDEREKDIIISLYMKVEPETLEQIGARYNLSKERVRQLKDRALKKLRIRFKDLEDFL